MSFRVAPLSILLAAALPFGAPAQDAGAQDPTIVLTRRVEPRIAYHALPRQENPIDAQAPVFTARAFGMAMDGATGAVGVGSVDDAILGALGAGGLDRRLAPNPAGTAPTGLGLRADPAARGTAPLGMSAAVGSVGGATSGLGDLVSRTLSQALGTGGHP